MENEIKNEVENTTTETPVAETPVAETTPVEAPTETPTETTPVEATPAETTEAPVAETPAETPAPVEAPVAETPVAAPVAETPAPVAETPTTPAAGNGALIDPNAQNNTTKIIIIAVVVVVAIVIVSIVMNKVGGSSNGGSGGSSSGPSGTGSAPTTTAKVDTKKLSAGISNEVSIGEDGNAVVIVKNNNKSSVSLEIEMEFYDDSNTLLDTKKEAIKSIGKGKEMALSIHYLPENWATYKIYVDADEVSSIYKFYFDSLEVTDNKTEDGVNVQVKNNSSDEISFIEATVVYYKDGKVVASRFDSESSVKSDRTALLSFRNPYDKEYKDIEYDDYKVFIYDAYGYSDY